MLTQRDRELLKYLVEKELKEFEKDSAIMPEDVIVLRGEEEYSQFLRQLLGKIR